MKNPCRRNKSFLRGFFCVLGKQSNFSVEVGRQLCYT